MRNFKNDQRSTGTLVIVKNNDVNRAMRKLKKTMQQEKIIQEYRERQYFEKPSLKRKRAKATAEKRWKKKLAQQQEI
jgi:small subunit ribosomal protein S21